MNFDRVFGMIIAFIQGHVKKSSLVRHLVKIRFHSDRPCARARTRTHTHTHTHTRGHVTLHLAYVQLSLHATAVGEVLHTPRAASAGLSIRNEYTKLIYSYNRDLCLRRRMCRAYYMEGLRKKTRRRRSRALSFLELLSHATVVLTLTSVTCNCYMLAYTPRYKRRTRNATHYSRVAHVLTLSSNPFFFFYFLREEEGASAKARAPGMWYRFSFAQTFFALSTSIAGSS